jgi:hypothetical protein
VAKRHYGGHEFLDASEREVIRLDDYFAGASRLDMIKTDTDGFDIDVLLGASALLSRLRPVLYFELAPFLARSADRDSREFLDFLADLGYRKYVVLAQAGEALSFTEAPAEVLRLADVHKYVDVVTASRLEQVDALPQIVAATQPP